MTDRYAEGLERAARHVEQSGVSHRGIIAASIRALTPVTAPTAPARLDADKTAQPLTEIRAVVPAGKRIVQPYGVEEYVYQETLGSVVVPLANPTFEVHPLGGATAPKHFEGTVHVTHGSTAVATPPRSEEQVRADERWRCVVAIGKMGHGEDKGTIKQAMFRIQALGPAPVDDTAARNLPREPTLTGLCDDLRHVCGKCGFRWPERAAYDELVTKLAAAEDRVRVLEGALRACHSACLRNECRMSIAQDIGAALAKKSEGT